MKAPLTSLPIATADGIFVAHYSENGLAEIDWPKAGRAELPLGQAARQRRPTKAIPAKIQSWHKLATAALVKILAGKPAGKLPPLDWTGKTEFQQSVWREMLKIPAGKTKSYGEVAAAIKNPNAVRAVGGACGANPIPVLVPCHRILAANKKIGGFTGGLERKRKLLLAEGINF
jgi:O-6-methylguanine DNA methyltransferase